MIVLIDMTFSILIFSRWQCYENSVTLGIVKCDQCQNTLDLLPFVWYFLKWILGYFWIHDNLQKMKDYTRRQFQENIRHDRWQNRIHDLPQKNCYLLISIIKLLLTEYISKINRSYRPSSIEWWWFCCIVWWHWVHTTVGGGVKLINQFSHHFQNRLIFYWNKQTLYTTWRDREINSTSFQSATTREREDWRFNFKYVYEHYL